MVEFIFIKITDCKEGVIYAKLMVVNFKLLHKKNNNF